MKLLLETAMILFGTLLAAGLVALGEPGSTGPAFQTESTHASRPSPTTLETVWPERTSAAQSDR